MNCYFLKAVVLGVAVAVLAATASADSLDVPAAPPLPSGLLLSSPALLWIAANVIFIWLVSSYRHHRADSAASHDDGVSAVMESLYPSSEHYLFHALVAPVDAVSKRSTREARTAARRQADRRRVRKKSAGEESPRAVAGLLARVADATPDGKKSAGEESPRAVEGLARAADATPLVGKKFVGEERPRAVAGLAGEAMPEGKKGTGEEEKPRASTTAAEAKPRGGDDVSIDSAWQSILRSGAARPVTIRKRETWAGEESPRAVAGLERAADATPVGKKPAGEERPRGAVAGLVTGAVPEGKKGTGEEGEEDKKPRAAADEAKPGGGDDISMDTAWQSIVRSGAARPVAVRKSETWAGEELPRMQRVAEKAVARREMRKSATMVPPSPPHPSAAAPAAASRQGWRTRDVLVMLQGGELLRRAESFIRRHHQHMRLQRQESEQRHQAMANQRS